MRVLLVDDHPMIQQVLGAVARGVFPAAHVDLASDLEQAIDLAGEGDGPEVVLLDLGLPGCSGIEGRTSLGWRTRETRRWIRYLGTLVDDHRFVPRAAA